MSRASLQVVVLFWMCWLFGCNSDPLNHRRFPKAAKVESLGPALQPISKTLLARIKSAEAFYELVDLGELTIFRSNDSLILGNLTQPIRIKDRWFLYDAYLQTILIADETGQLIGELGGLGGGPGEFGRIEGVKRVWGDHIAVVNLGKLDIFEVDGSFLRELTVEVGSQQFHTTGIMFSWDHRERLFVGNFPSYELDLPAHGIFAYDGNEFKIIGGFGERIAEQFRAKGLPALSSELLAEIRGAIWTACLYRSEFQLYDLNGHLLKRLPIHHPDVRGISDFEELADRKAFFDLMTSTCGPYNIFPLGPLVVAVYVLNGKLFCNIYDTTGRLLRRHLPMPMRYGAVHDSYEGNLYFRGRSPADPADWPERHPEHVLQHLSQEGLDLKEVDGPAYVLQVHLKDS